MAKVAIPISNELLSNQFNNCGYYDIFEIDNKEIVSKDRENYCRKSVNELNQWILSNGITDVIVHGIDKTSVLYFSDTKVNLFIGVKINTSEALINEYLNGSLRSNSKFITTII